MNPLFITIGPFPVRIKSLNKTLRTHYSRRGKDSDDLLIQIRPKIFCHPAKDLLTRPIKKRATFVSCRRRRLDYDNLVGGFKPVVDILTKLKVFVDDSPDWLEATYRQVTGDDAFWIEIEV